MTEHSVETAYNTLLNITNHNISQHLTPNKNSTNHKTPLKSALKHSATHSAPDAEPDTAADTAAVQLDSKSAKILGVLGQAYSEIKQLLLHSQMQHDALQQQYNALQAEHNTLKQYSSEVQTQLNSVQQRAEQKIQQAREEAVQNKHTQNLHVAHRLRTANNTLNVCTVFNAWRRAYYRHALNKQKQRYSKQLNQQAEQLQQQHAAQVTELNNTVEQQQATIAQLKLSQLTLTDKLKQALLRSVCAVNSEALNVLNDAVYTDLHDIVEPNSVELLPQPHGKQYSTVPVVPSTVKKVGAEKRGNYKHNVMKQIHVHNTHVFR